MKTSSTLQMSFLFILAILLITAGPACGKTPWEWVATLQDDSPGNAMVMAAALFVDPDRERYYVVDTGNNRLVSFDRAGQLLQAFDAAGQLRGPGDLVRLADGSLWVVEKGRNTLTHIDLQARKTTPHTLRQGEGTVIVDRLETNGDSLYLLNRITGTILMLNRDLAMVNQFQSPAGSSGFSDFKIAQGAVWALATNGKAIYRFSENGELRQEIRLQEPLAFPSSLALDQAGLFYVLERHGGTVAVFDQAGVFKYRFLGPGQARGQLFYPAELQFDPWGRLCIVEEGNGRVQIFDR